MIERRLKVPLTEQTIFVKLFKDVLLKHKFIQKDYPVQIFAISKHEGQVPKLIIDGKKSLKHMTKLMGNDEIIKHEDKIIIYLPIFKDLDYYQDLKTKVQPKTSNMLLKLQKAYRQIDFNLD
jgi:hypothetical protein